MGIRKRLANVLNSTATLLESDTSKEYISTKLKQYRVRAAAFILPNDIVFTVTPQD
jgi:hypothetical protein